VKESKRHYLMRVLIAFDQFFNVLVFNGRPDHTISGRVGYFAIKGEKWALYWEKIINTLFFWQADHCRKSIEWDEMK